HTGNGRDTHRDVYQDRRHQIWDERDTATLRDDRGRVLDRELGAPRTPRRPPPLTRTGSHSIGVVPSSMDVSLFGVVRTLRAQDSPGLMRAIVLSTGQRSWADALLSAEEVSSVPAWLAR
ncbi:hypothetical protein ACFYP3_37545, partial [Streptomyces sp. NPDC005533]